MLADTLNARLRETLRARSPLRRRRVLAFALVVDALRLRNVRFEKKKGPRPIGERPNHPGDVCGGGRRVVDANVDRVGAARQARHERKWNTGSNDQSFHTGYPQPAHNLTVRSISAFTRSHERSCAAILQLVLRVSFTRYRDLPMRRIVSNSLSARRRNDRSREAAGGPRRSLPEDGLEKVRHSGAVGEPRPRFARQRTFVARGIWRFVSCLRRMNPSRFALAGRISLHLRLKSRLTKPLGFQCAQPSFLLEHLHGNSRRLLPRLYPRPLRT